MLQEAIDFRAEADELHAFLRTLGERDWSRPTTFQRWTPWDVVAHLHLYDQVSLASLAGEEAFAAERNRLVGRIAKRRDQRGSRARAIRRARRARSCSRTGSRARAISPDQLAASDPKRRLPWFGPDMGVRMFTTARLMETWAHGQEVYDLVRVERAHTDRLRHIAEIGVQHVRAGRS